MARKMYREAIDVYREGDLKSHVIWNKLGIAHHQMTQIDEARKHYERAVKLNPKYAEAINNLGTVHYAKKSYRRAVSQYQKALKLTPNSASVYSNLGTAQFARKKYKEALEAYQKAISLDPEVFEHRSAYGTLLQERSVERAGALSLLPRENLRTGGQRRARAAVHPHGPRRGIQRARQADGRSRIRDVARNSRIQGVDGDRTARAVKAALLAKLLILTALILTACSKSRGAGPRRAGYPSI